MVVTPLIQVIIVWPLDDGEFPNMNPSSLLPDSEPLLINKPNIFEEEKRLDILEGRPSQILNEEPEKTVVVENKDFRMIMTEVLMLIAMLMGSGLKEDRSNPLEQVKWMYKVLANRFNEVRFQRAIEVGNEGELSIDVWTDCGVARNWCRNEQEPIWANNSTVQALPDLETWPW